MKTFRNLVPGDTFYVANMSGKIEPEEPYNRSGKCYPSNVHSFEIESIYLENDKVKFKRKGSREDFYEVSIEYLDRSYVYLTISKFRYGETILEDYIYFACSETLDAQLRDVGLLLLKKEDKNLEEYTKRIENTKKRIRIAFFEYLN